MRPEDFASLESAFLATFGGSFAAGAVDQFLSVLRDHYPEQADWTTLRRLLVDLGNTKAAPSLQAQVGENDRPFAESIAAFRAGNSPLAGFNRCPIRELGLDFDFLANTCFLPNLTPLQLVNLLLLRTLRPTKSVAVVVTMRDEGTTLLEWIAFYQAIGIASIVVYTNDNVDGSEELLELLASAGVITLIRNSIAIGTNPQRKAYQHAVHLLRELRDYIWVLFLDADEFLVVDQRFDYRLDRFIHHVEDTFQQSLPGAVVFPWDWRLSDLGFERTDGLLFERYPHSVPNFTVKSMTRLSASLGMCEVHIPTLEHGASIIDSALQPMELHSVWSSNHKSREGGAISHFWGKSFEEFAVKKRRGELLYLEDNGMLREFSQYFEWTVRPGAENYHPVPPILLQRTKRALHQLLAITGVEGACEMVQVRFRELTQRIQKETNLREIYDGMRSSVQSVLE